MIDSKVFNKLDLGSKLNFAKRNALQAHDGERKTGVDREKSEAEQDMIRKGIQRNAKLTEVVHLDDAHLDAMVEAAYRQRCEPGTVPKVYCAFPRRSRVRATKWMNMK